MKKTGKFFVSLLLCFALAAQMLPAFAQQPQEESENTLLIRSVKDFMEFADRCRRDDYSEGLTVSLETDLTIHNNQFKGVPSFSGKFEGNGRTISVRIAHEGSVAGLFRYLTKEAEVHNLNVQGDISPDGTKRTVGGIAGSNAGLIENCSFSGTVSGSDCVGGIAGLNRVTGVIEQCSVTGSAMGNHFVGGVAGRSFGVIRGCTNHADINTTAGEKNITISDISRDTILGTEAADTVTDVGGIAGISSGVIRGCTNRGKIGYQSMGYNIGGIAGQSRGLIAESTNLGEVSGRKEIAGIAGQLEPVIQIEYAPDTLAILEGQLRNTSALAQRTADHANGNEENINRHMSDLHEQAKVSAEAVGEILFKDNDEFFPDEDRITAAKNTLSSSMTEMQGTVDSMLDTARSGADVLTSDIRAITGQIDAMAQTIKSAGDHEGLTVTDVSDEDTDDDKTAKIENCTNRAAVLGDLNVGGIAGMVAVENDLDPEDDEDAVGKKSLNAECKMRAVITGCENTARIAAKKKNAGGIAGKMKLGLVKNCTNTGLMDAENAERIGGIAGDSHGTIRSSFAKCAIAGETAVGGIAGTADCVTDCRSMVQLHGGTEQLGSVMGIYDGGEPADPEKISNNYYLAVGEDVGGVDGVSYRSLAQSMTQEEFLALENLPEMFRSAVITFWTEDGELIRKLVVPLGERFDAAQAPEVPEKEGYVAQWKGLSEAEGERTGFDHEFMPEYNPLRTVIESSVRAENGRPAVLAEGIFTKMQKIETGEPSAMPQPEHGTVVSAYSIPEFEGEAVTHLRVAAKTPEKGKKMILMTCGEDGVWTQPEFEQDGSYLITPTDGSVRGVSVVQVSAGPSAVFVMSLCCAAAVLVIVVVILLRRRRKKRKEKTRSVKQNE